MLAQRTSNSACFRQFSTLTKLSQKIQEEKSKKKQAPKEFSHDRSLPKDSKFVGLSEKQNVFLDRLIRVDQAGELGANYIYQGQIFALLNKYPHLRPVLTHMWEQEVHHHNTFNELQHKHRVRPSLLTPLWKLGAVGMGFVTGAILKEAAMACTVAVETVIGGHYNEQLRFLMKEFNDNPVIHMETGTVSSNEHCVVVSEEIESLKQTVKLFRDQELEHLDTAIEHDAESAVPYWLITDIIMGICKTAIATVEKI